jgi:ribonuclease HI
VIGFAIFFGSIEHENNLISDRKVSLIKIEEKNNIRAEIKSVLSAFQSLISYSSSKNIVLFCDCQTIVRLPLRRAKLESLDFKSISKNIELANTDLYREFYKFYDLYNIEIQWIKGHTSKSKLNPIENNFYFLDKAVRSKLRQIISELN